MSVARFEEASSIFCAELNRSFDWFQGPVSFDGADRIGITAFYQMQGE